MNIPWTCNEYVVPPHTNQGTRDKANCCKTCGRTKEAHEAYAKYKDKQIIIWNGKRYTFKDIEEMTKNRFFPG